VCSRYLSWLDRSDIEFRADKADRVINFVQNLEHFTGHFAGQKFILSDWQRFIVYYVYGFYYSGTNERVIKHVIIDVSRKNGKTALVAALALYALIGEKEENAEVDCLANSKNQASILLQTLQGFCRRADRKGKYLKSTLNKVKFAKTNSFAQVLSTELCGLDGFNSYWFCIDEAGSGGTAKFIDLFNVLSSSQGARKNPLSFITTTAGHNPLCPYYQMRKSAIDVIQGRIVNDSLVAFIYTLDEGDNWTDEGVWIKSNPNLNITVSTDYIKDRITQARTSSLIENDVKVKTLNCWVQSVETWISDSELTKSMQRVNLSDFPNAESYVGVDLAAVSDLTCWTALFPPDAEREHWPDKYVFKTFVYLPEQTVEQSENAHLYRRFIERGELSTTPGNVTDYDYILSDILKLNETAYILSVAYDAWNATQFATSATNEGLPMVPFSQSLGNFNKPTKEFERLLKSGKVIIDLSEVVRWCFSNVRIKSDHNDNTKPDKSTKAQKIDCVISMLEALGAYLARSGGPDVSALLADVLEQR